MIPTSGAFHGAKAIQFRTRRLCITLFPPLWRLAVVSYAQIFRTANSLTTCHYKTSH